MPSFTSLFARGRQPRPGALGKIVFVCYGGFDCNSAGHIAGFARGLKDIGYAVGVAARDGIGQAWAFGEPAFEPFTLQDLGREPEAVMAFDGRFEPERTMLVCWTPRKASRQALVKARRRHPVRYIVHFEDNEELLSELRLADLESRARDAAERAALLAGASGASLIAEPLRRLLPQGLPQLLLEPGVDSGLFGAPLPPHRRASLLRGVGAPQDAAVIVYPGNLHRANAQEMLDLYRAVKRLRDRGRKVVLLKTGKDDALPEGALEFDPAGAGVIALGHLDRPFLVELMKCADLFVQPGAPGPFNDFRLPSKLPEFMSIGRPVILPATNLGLRLKDGQEALLLRTGSPDEIAAKAEQVLADPTLARRLADGAQAFARRTWRWDVQAGKLAGFLESLARTA